MGKKYITEKPAKYGRKRFRKEISIPNPLRISFHFKIQIKDNKKVKPKITIPCQPVKTERAFFIVCQPTNLIIQKKSPTPIKREIKNSKKFFKFIYRVPPCLLGRDENEDEVYIIDLNIISDFHF